MNEAKASRRRNGLLVGTKVSLIPADKTLPIFETEIIEVDPNTRIIKLRDELPKHLAPGDKIALTAELKALEALEDKIERVETFNGNSTRL